MKQIFSPVYGDLELKITIPHYNIISTILKSKHLSFNREIFFLKPSSFKAFAGF